MRKTNPIRNSKDYNRRCSLCLDAYRNVKTFFTFDHGRLGRPVSNGAREKGVALIMTLGLLVVMSILGISFATSMRLGEKGCRAFLWNVQAKYLAEGGIARAIADLKYNATQGAINRFLDDGGEDWYPSDGAGNDIEGVANPSYQSFGTGVSGIGSDGSLIDFSGNIVGTVKLKVIDTASQININDSVNPDLIYSDGGPNTILENLVGILGGMDAGIGNAICSGRPYYAKRDIDLIDNVGPVTYDRLKDYITISSYQDPSNADKSAININTTSREVLQAIFQTVASDEAEALTNAIIAHGPFDNMAELRTVIRDNSGSPDSVIEAIDSNYTDADEVAQNHTKFIFNSGGVYEIECLAKVGVNRTERPDLEEAGDVVLAEKKVKAVVQIFNMWNQTTTEDFQGEVDLDWDGELDDVEDIDGNDTLDEPVYERVTWLDSCPINVSVSYPPSGYNEVTAETIAGAIKMGFWENFDFWDDDGDLIQERWNYSKGQWYNQQGWFYVKQSGALSGTVRAVWDRPDSGVEFFSASGSKGYPILALGRADTDRSRRRSTVPIKFRDRWRWSEFSLRLYERSYDGQFDTEEESIVDKGTSWKNELIDSLTGRVKYRHLTGSGINDLRRYDIGAHVFMKRRSESSNDQEGYQRDIFINHIDPWEWDREFTDPERRGIDCGRWNPEVDPETGEISWIDEATGETLPGVTFGYWYAIDTLLLDPDYPEIRNQKKGWGKNDPIFNHEGVFDRQRGWGQPPAKLNEDDNKNPLSGRENDNPNQNTFLGAVDLQNNIEATNEAGAGIDKVGWNGIYYYPKAFPENYYLCLIQIPIVTGDDEVEEEDTSRKLSDDAEDNKYYEGATYNIVYKKAGATDEIIVNATLYNYNEDNDADVVESLRNETTSRSATLSVQYPDSLFALYAARYSFIARDIRIVGKDGFYTSNPFTAPSVVEWGTIWGTETIPDTANSDSEKIAFQVSVDDGAWSPAVDQYTEIDSQIQPEGGAISANGTSIKYRANFTTADPDYSETPLLEDVWITYLPTTRILYWKEG